jgi:hypothetical protein
MRIGLLRFFLASCMLAACLQAETQQGNALMLFDAYLARAALERIAYRTDLQPGGNPRTVPPGRLLGSSPTLGPFTYRPKTYDELTRAERAALMRDPKLHSFLIATREQFDRGTSASGPASPAAARPRIERIAIPPEEMLRSQPMFITLPADPEIP